ncbi:MAG: exopolysaccharide biosynthesis polyprenyl glycosylphosphotransferase [bacterium]|nr:exopolysaccharide biosynthesis polyprenyl glycosylphosphotransferase [bacterium]
MKIKSITFVWFLLAGDIIVLALSLLISLTLRYFLPRADYVFSYQRLLSSHILPFTLVFILWIFIFYLGGFYRVFAFGNKLALAQNLFRLQLTNSVIALVFFYLIPYFLITPKINLLLFIIISYCLLLGWRASSLLLFKAARGGGRFFFIGPDRELQEIKTLFHSDARYSGFEVAGAISFEDLASDAKLDLSSLVAPSNDFRALAAAIPPQQKERLAKKFYELIFKGVTFFDFQKFYENVFQRVPVSLINESWFLENITLGRRRYDFAKRFLDIFGALISGILSLILYPFIIAAIKLDDGGPVFYTPERVGQHGRVFHLIKFRSMRVREASEATWPEKDDPRITRVGGFLRRTRLDELPQLWNIFKGDLSLVGPRPDHLSFAKLLEEKIPYYNIRTLVKPGLTGWAQVMQDVEGVNPSSVPETETRLSYDIYYLKNRSLFLDTIIVLKTIRTLLSRPGV